MTAKPQRDISPHKGDKSLFLSLKKYQDKEAFLAAYDQYFDQIFRFIFFKIGNREDAQDLTSATFLKCWGYVQEGKLKSEREYKSLKSFLYKIARNLTIDYYRQAKPQTSLEEVEEIVVDFGSSLAQTETLLEYEWLVDKLQELKGEYRNILVLKYINNLSIAEISLILGKTKGNVRVTLYRSLEALKNLTRDHDGEDSHQTIE
jgi:RNA polymerase sigma-70 factor (ECF subfamily)